MRKKLLYISCLYLFQNAMPALASDVGVNVILFSEVKPGVYGQVELDNNPRPRVLYANSLIIHRDEYEYRREPIYMHVPPDHARYWSRHCDYYHACGRRVYFVRSEEYEPQYQRYERERHYYDTHPRKDDSGRYPNEYREDHHDNDHNNDRHDNDHHDNDRHDDKDHNNKY